jgi:imidazole glycerol-phosphate synthase subunit HisH
MMATLLDYGAGNLHSLAKAIGESGMSVRVEAHPARAAETDLLVLPGVGAFPFAAERIAPARSLLRDAILAGLPTIGICLGMQLLFAESDEGPGAGLAVFDGTVTRVAASRLPHIGWNTVEPARCGVQPCGALRTAYFANSFACRPADDSLVAAWTTHEEDRFPAMVRRGAVCAMQFHPEKSSSAGVALLRSVIAEVVAR